MFAARLIIFFGVLFMIVNPLLAQSYSPNKRSVSVNTADSIVRAEIWNTETTIKPSPELDYYWYHAGVINHNHGGYSGKLLHGKYETFDNQRNLIAQGSFANGVMTGIWNRWYSNGNIRFSGEYKEGKLIGIVKAYTKDGKLLSAVTYAKGLMDGKALFYGTDTVISRKYKAGKEIFAMPKKTKEKKKTQEKVKPSEAGPLPTAVESKPKKKWNPFAFLKKKEKKTEEKHIPTNTGTN